jgi:hypothetical protein
MLLETIGWTADACFVSAFWLVSSGRIPGEGWLFNSINLAGALLYGFYAWNKDAIPVLVLEVFWGGIALIAIAKLLRGRSTRVRTTDD